MSNKDHLRAARILTKVLDDQFKLFGIRIGFDPVLDLIPVFGSVIGAVPVVGWIGDIFYKSNRMNMDILKKSLPDTVIEGKIVS